MSVRDQAGVLPFRRKRDCVEICLIRSTGRKKWKIPKGFVDPGETAQKAALKEAWEEAGVHGRLVGDAIGSYEYSKWGLNLTVAVFLMEVTAEEDVWPESQIRERTWKALDEAAARLKDHPVRSLFPDAIAMLEGKKRTR